MWRPIWPRLPQGSCSQSLGGGSCQVTVKHPDATSMHQIALISCAFGTRCMHRLVTLSGERLDIESCLDIVVMDLGLTQFVVVKTMAHKAFLRWDQMARRGRSLDSNAGVLKSGSTLLPVVTPIGEFEAAIINAGCLTHIFTKYWEIFGELRSTSHAVPLSNRMTKAVCTTAASRCYNYERLNCKANSADITVNDQVRVKGQWITPLTGLTITQSCSDEVRILQYCMSQPEKTVVRIAIRLGSLTLRSAGMGLELSRKHSRLLLT